MRLKIIYFIWEWNIYYPHVYFIQTCYVLTHMDVRAFISFYIIVVLNFHNFILSFPTKEKIIISLYTHSVHHYTCFLDYMSLLYPRFVFLFRLHSPKNAVEKCTDRSMKSGWAIRAVRARKSCDRDFATFVKETFAVNQMRIK